MTGPGLLTYLCLMRGTVPLPQQPRDEGGGMSSSNVQHVSHGNTVAAWTGVLILLVAAGLICLGIVFAQPFLWVPGVIGVPAGGFAWAALNRAGYGEEPR